MKWCILTLAALAAQVESSPSCESCCVVTVYPPMPEPTECSPETVTETKIVTETTQVVTTISEHVTVVVTSTISATTDHTSSSYETETYTSETSPPTSRTGSPTTPPQTVCPAPTNGPCDKPEAPYEPGSNNTFGCAPGFVCDRPKPRGCKLWADAPEDDYVCSSRFCIPSPPYSRAHWPEGETGYVPPDEGYFNLNPNAFGLLHSIFEYETIVKEAYGKEYTITTGNWASATELSVFPTPSPSEGQRASPFWDRLPDAGEQDEGDPPTAPAVCFDDCNNCYKEALAVGKSPALCRADSQFRGDYQLCVSCIDANAEDGPSVRRRYVNHKFAQFLRYCDGQDTVPTQPTSSDASSEATPTPEPTTESYSQPLDEDATFSEPPATTSEASSSSSSSRSAGPTSRPDEDGNGPGETTKEPMPTSAGGNQPPPPPSSGESPAESASNTDQTSVGAGGTMFRPDAIEPNRTASATESVGRDGTTTSPVASFPEPTPSGMTDVHSSASHVESLGGSAVDSTASTQSEGAEAWPTAATPSFAIGASSRPHAPDLWILASLFVCLHAVYLTQST